VQTTITGNGSNWAIVSNSNKLLVAAHSIRSDTSYYVIGINKRLDTGEYTLIFNQSVPNGFIQEMWITWID
jgi:hypothetical protein